MQEFWEFPGGKLAGDESADEALRRELVEELGVEITSCVHLHSLEHDYPEMRVEIDFFLVRKWRFIIQQMLICNSTSRPVCTARLAIVDHSRKRTVKRC